MSPQNRPPVDEHFLHDRLDALERVLQDRAVPLHVRLRARDEIERIRAELDPTRATCELSPPSSDNAF